MNSIRPIVLALALAAATLLAGCGPSTEGQPLSTRVNESPWESSSPNSRKLETAHYRIFTTDPSQTMIQTLPPFMEAAYRNYLKLTGLADKPLPPMVIYMMGTRKEWEVLTRSVVKGQASIYLSIQAGGYCYDKVCVFWDFGGLGTLATASHEGLHQFLAHRMTDHLPLWLEEGLCTQAEGNQILTRGVLFDPVDNVLRKVDLKKALMTNNWIPLETLLPMDAGDAVVKSSEYAMGYYGQLWSLVLFIRSEPAYRKGLERLMADAEAGRLYEGLNLPKDELGQVPKFGRQFNKLISRPIFEHYFSKDVKAFEKQYKAFSMKLVGVGG